MGHQHSISYCVTAEILHNGFLQPKF